MLLRILTFFKWVYGNPLTFLVGIRRIPAYHVDYTTVFMSSFSETADAEVTASFTRSSCMCVCNKRNRTSVSFINRDAEHAGFKYL